MLEERSVLSLAIVAAWGPRPWVVLLWGPSLVWSNSHDLNDDYQLEVEVRSALDLRSEIDLKLKIGEPLRTLNFEPRKSE